MGIGPDRLLLTHSPDRMTSQWPLMHTGKTFFVKGSSFSEVVGDELFPMDGDIYHKEAGKYYVGYRSERGRHTVLDSDGTLSLSTGSKEGEGDPLFRVELFEDLSGRYFSRPRRKRLGLPGAQGREGGNPGLSRPREHRCHSRQRKKKNVDREGSLLCRAKTAVPREVPDGEGVPRRASGSLG